MRPKIRDVNTIRQEAAIKLKEWGNKYWDTAVFNANEEMFKNISLDELNRMFSFNKETELFDNFFHKQYLEYRAKNKL